MLTMGINAKNRYQAFGLHFLISLTIVTCFAYLIFYSWYREPFFTAEGGWSIFHLIIIIDLILGPVLTLIIFKKGKKGLKFDLSAIATVQALALVYGGTVLYQERPAYLTFSVDRFVIVSENDIDNKKLRHPAFVNKEASEKPQLVFAKLPEDPKERNAFVEEVFDGKPDLEFRAEYYEPFEGKLESVMLKSKDIHQLKNSSEENKQKIEFFLKDHCQYGCGYFPLVGKKHNMLIAIDKKDGHIVGGINIDPWRVKTQMKTARRHK